MRTLHRCSPLVVLVVFLAVVGSGSHAIGQLPEQAGSVSAKQRGDTARLLSIEQAVLPPSLVSGPPAYEDLPAYYAAANPQLSGRLERIRKLYGDRANRPLQAITLVAGDAGVGKTFLKKKVLGKDCPAEAVFKFDIREQYEEWRQQGITIALPDLQCGDQIINSLPSVFDRRDKPLLRLLKSKSAHFVIIDSIDEVHPDDYRTILEQVEGYAFSSDLDFVHVVVFGRPCAFTEYWAARGQNHPERDIQLLELHPPQLRTTGDLLVSSWNYCSWKFEAQWSLASGETAPLSFADFAEWSQADFVTAGRFSSISMKSNREMTPLVRDTLLQFAQQYRVVGPTLGNLSGNTILREIVASRVEQGRPYDEREIMDAYFQAWLERDYKSDGRPSYEHPEYVSLYLQLLERIAAKYASPDKVDQLGFFTVADSDQVQLVHDGQRWSFPVQRVLDRSGLIHVDPTHVGLQQYRFEPIWLHRYLVQRYNE